jgi:hypothetical protein
MREIGTEIGFLILAFLVCSRLWAKRRRKQHEYFPTTKRSYRQLPWRAPQVIDSVGQVRREAD